MQEVLRTIDKIAPSHLSLVIIGEHGTGKEWAARKIHELSQRSKGPFWPFDCAAVALERVEKELFGAIELTRDGISILRGAFEEASSGTLLLNEMDSLPPVIQKKVSRALEYGTILRVGEEKAIPVDVRIIGTLNRPADVRFDDKTPGDEWFVRFSPFLIEIPPLRERREDIPGLIDGFIEGLRVRHGSLVKGVSAEAQETLVSYNWPGNVRNLRSAIEYAVVMAKGSVVQTEDLPPYLLQNHQHGRSSIPIEHRKV